MASTLDILLLFIPLIIITGMIIFLVNVKKKNQLHKIFIILFSLLFMWFVGLLLQISLSSKLNLEPIYFEYFIYISACFLPVFILIMSLIFINTKINLNSKYLLLFVIPVISLLVLWTNDIHHLFYNYYSIHINETVFGPYFYIHTIYSYVCIAIGLISLIYYSIKNSGFFSKQSLLICMGSVISLLINIIATFGILDLSIYVTPISFAIEIFLISLSIFKFNFLSISPIALQRVVDSMSDGYIVVNDENIVTDFNQTFLELFSLKTSELRNININDLITKLSSNSEKRHTFLDAINKTKSDDTTIKIESHFSRVK